ncbi:MAG: hypothetical protein ACI3YB_03395 [Prevotella sp.]
MRKTILILFLAINCGLAKAQYHIGKSAYQLMMEKALNGAMCIVEQDYLVQDTVSGNYFGKNNKPQFNTIISLGVLANDKLILNERATNPSKFDPDFEKYIGKYKAALSTTRFHFLDDTIKYTYKDKKLQEGFVGLEICDPESTESGWIVFVTQSPNKQKFDITIYNKNYNCKSDTLIDSSEWNHRNLIGGFYIKPSYPVSGSIDLKLCGVLTSEKQGKWFLSPVNIEKEEISENKTDVAVDDDVLTPIKDTSKNTKKKRNKK